MSENETKCGKAVSKQLNAGEYRMSQGTMHSLKTTVNISVTEFVGGNQSVPTATNRRNEDILDRYLNDSILHQ